MRPEQQNAYLTRFESEVTRVEQRDGATWVTLATSAFYPSSGGQPHDTGRLANARVVEVVKRPDAEGAERVWHRLDDLQGEGPTPGMRVVGEIDWQRRYRHMQRHTAQHLLSQAFVRLSPAFVTRSVALGGPTCTVDLDGEPDPAALAEAERLVNEVGYRNLTVRAFEVDESELARYLLRRPTHVGGRIRLVAIGDPDAFWELSACGGTHVASSAETLPIKLLDTERVKRSRTRVAFRAGLDALDDYRLKHEVARALSLAFSARVDEVPARVEALQSELSDQLRLGARLETRLAEERALGLLARAQRIASGLVVDAVLPEADAALLGPLADALASSPGVIALLGAASDGRARLLFARADDVDSDMRALLATALRPIEGRGGGRPERAQGAGVHPERLRDALALARRELTG